MRNKVTSSIGRRAVVLLSGGLDSATTLYLANDRGFRCFCLTFDYGQRHKREITAAKKLAGLLGCRVQTIKINLPWRGSALLDKNSLLPRGKRWQNVRGNAQIPNTYVPGRNIIFLSFAISYAETIGAEAIFIGAHAQDYSGYPDCRPEFYQALNAVIAKGTKAGVEGHRIRVETPLINKTKSQIITLGQRLGVPFRATWSCYGGKSRPCGVCDSCYFRAKGFEAARLKDPLKQK